MEDVTTNIPVAQKPNPLTAVTPLSKALAVVLFIALPFLGFYFGTKYQEWISPYAGITPTSKTMEPTLNDSASSSARLQSTQVNAQCKNIQGLSGYELCTGKTIKETSIKGPEKLLVEHVSKYTVSPNKKLIFVVRYSDSDVLQGGAPTENALTMIDVTGVKFYELFSQIYFPNYDDPNSWSSDSKGIVFTAGGGADSKPDILKGSDMYSVVYCGTACRVLAKNAGPLGIPGNPAYFENGKIYYTGKNGEQLITTLK